MADSRLQIQFNDNTYFGGIIPDGLVFTGIDMLPTVFQTSYCGQLWRKKVDVVGIKVADVVDAGTALGFVLRDDPTWPILIKILFGEVGVDVYDSYVAANIDNAFVGATVLYP